MDMLSTLQPSSRANISLHPTVFRTLRYVYTAERGVDTLALRQKPNLDRLGHFLTAAHVDHATFASYLSLFVNPASA